MAIDDKTATFSALFSGGASRQNQEQEKILQALQQQVRQDTLAKGDALLALFRALPAAALASERAEHERLVGRYGKDHPRAQALEKSLDGLERAEVQAVRGRARAARAMEMARMPEPAFHGFVADEAGEPLPGMTVRVVSPRLGTELAAPTKQDGYFHLVLPEAVKKQGKRNAELAEVIIVDGQGKRVHEDPLPLQLDAGSAYREYIVALHGAVSEKKAKRAAKDTSRPRKRRKR
jgi:hypothetical protein